eukprot:COSAG05_NODE_3568_length_1987_cov_1.138242_2_plen_66_part_01
MMANAQHLRVSVVARRESFYSRLSSVDINKIAEQVGRSHSMHGDTVALRVNAAWSCGTVSSAIVGS